MAFRFWRRLKIASGVTLNLSKSGGSLSFGPRGAKVTLGKKGVRKTVGIPGSGLFYTTTTSYAKSSGKKRTSAPPVPTVPIKDRLTLGFFKRLFTPDDEEALVDGCKELALGDEDKALAFFRNAAHLADSAYIAGFLSLKKEQLDRAAEYLKSAVDKYRALGRYFNKYGISAIMSLRITEHIAAHVGPDIRGVRLGLVEVYQRQKRWEDAIQTLRDLQRLEPDDPVIQLSLVELLLEARPDDRNTCRRIVHMLQDTENETEIHAALLYYKAKALRRLCLNEAARDTLTKAFRRKKDRSPELLRAIQYERILVYEDLGKKKRARTELEKLYAESLDHEHVAETLGV